MGYVTESGTEYEVELYDPFGLKLDWLNNFISLDYIRTVNQRTPLVITLPYHPRIWRLLRRDCRIALLRKPTDRQEMILETETIWLLRGIERNIDQGTITLTAYCGLDILERPIVAFATNSPFATKHAEIDFMMKTIVYHNLVEGRDQGGLTPRRSIQKYFEIETGINYGPIDRIQCARQRVLQVLQNLSALSMTYGDENTVLFDVVWVNNKFLFRTYMQERGTDRRYGIVNNALTIGPDDASLVGITLSLNWDGEVTYVYAGGAGMFGDRLVAAVQDTERASLSPFMGICEAWEDAQSYGVNPDGVATAARIRMNSQKPQLILQGQIQQTVHKQYGRDWFWGDRVTAVITDDDGYSQMFDVVIWSVRVQIQNGQERISAVVRGTERK